jgi:hypothetical protein
LAVAACGGFDRPEAAREIRDRFCDEWPYGCSDDLRVVVEEVREAGAGRLVDFRIEDGGYATEPLSGAYFARGEDGWDLVFFEDPFRTELDEGLARFARDRRTQADRLLRIQTAQEWHRSIHGRYATNLEELTRVSYVPPEGVSVRVGDPSEPGGWMAEANGRFTRCVMDGGDALPKCELSGGTTADEGGGPLAATFGPEGGADGDR